MVVYKEGMPCTGIAAADRSTTRACAHPRPQGRDRDTDRCCIVAIHDAAAQQAQRDHCNNMASADAPARPADDVIAAAILEMAAARGPDKSICPSEVARAVATGGSEAAWRAIMPAVRGVAAALADEGRIVVTQRGVVVDARSAVGPIRLKVVPAGSPGAE